MSEAVNHNARITRPWTSWYNRPGTGWELISTHQGVRYHVVQQRPKSVTTPRRSDGTRPPLPWNHTWSRCSGIVGDYSSSDGGQWRGLGYCPDSLPTSSYMPGFDLKLRDVATLNALVALKNSKVNLGVALAEARQTAELVAAASNRIAKQVDRFSRSKAGRKAGSPRAWKKIPQAYLELSYGWVPLLSDVDGASKALADAVYGPRRNSLNFTVEGRARSSSEYDLYWRDGIINATYKGAVEENVLVKLACELPVSLLQPLVQAGLTNPFEVMWEKVPYSFVVDWFLPVGNALSALDAGAYTQFREGSVSHILRLTAPAVQGKPDKPALYKFSPTMTGTWHGGRFERSVLHTLPMFVLPRLKSPLSIDKAAKGLSLLSQVFQNWRRRG